VLAGDGAGAAVGIEDLDPEDALAEAGPVQGGRPIARAGGWGARGRPELLGVEGRGRQALRPDPPALAGWVRSSSADHA
jgi:hypothetical protein